VQQLPKADRLTWKRTLTGAALIGTGAGSVANVARSAGALFKGGGGSFGGGGASGSFGSAQAAAAAAAKGTAAKSAAAPGAAALGAVGTGAASSDEASSETAEPGARPAFNPSTRRSPSQRSWLDAVAEQWHRLRWYHAVAFVLIGLIFLPVGMSASAILQNGNLLLGLVLVGLSVWASVEFVNTERLGEFRGLVAFLFMALLTASFWLANHSTAPYWHLAGVGAVVGAGALYRAWRRASDEAAPDRPAPFEGGAASQKW